MELRGQVDAIEPDQGRRLINNLTKKYVGREEHTLDGPDDIRVVVRISPQRAQAGAA